MVMKLGSRRPYFPLRGKMKGGRLLMVVYCLITLMGDLVEGELESSSKVPCYFVFGDSQADNGNNNIMEYGEARADYKPYGIDFAKDQTPTGRFTNGRNIPDFIAKYLKFDRFIPPFKNTKSRNILRGLNYASGGAGILLETGRTLGKITSINEQLENHNVTVSQINSFSRNTRSASSHLKSCLYTVQIGSNDYLNNYFMPQSYQTSVQYTPQRYAIALNKELSSQLKILYDQGARKVAVFGVGSIGCTPYARANFELNGAVCVEKINDAIQQFNIGLKSLVDQLNTQLAGAKFTFIDVFKMSSIQPSNYGDMVLDVPCCEVPAGQKQCAPNGKVCENRKNYMFWDGVHPTEVGFSLVASRAFNASDPEEANPYDINHLVQLK